MSSSLVLSTSVSVSLCRVFVDGGQTLGGV